MRTFGATAVAYVLVVAGDQKPHVCLNSLDCTLKRVDFIT